MEAITEFIKSPWVLGIIVMVSVISLGAKEILMARSPAFVNIVRILNFPIIISVILFFYVFSRIVIKIIGM